MERLRQKESYLMNSLYLLEITFFWGVLFWISTRGVLNFLSIVILGFSFSVFFSFYYGLKASVLNGIYFFLFFISFYKWQLADFWIKGDILSFVSGEIVIFLTGILSQDLRKKVINYSQFVEILKKREEETTADLISVDFSYHKFLKENFFSVRTQSYLYQELRIAAVRQDLGAEFFIKAFKILNRYAFVEEGSIYTFSDSKSQDLIKIFEYGLSNFPKKIDAKREEWVRVVQEKGEIVVSLFPGKHGFFLVIPIFVDKELSLKGYQDLFIVIEQVRYTMLDEQTYINLKVLALILKLIIERKLEIELLEKEGIETGSAVIYKKEKAKRVLKKRIGFLQDLKVDYAFLLLDLEGLSSKDRDFYLTTLESVLRIFDEKFYLSEDKVLSRLQEREIDPGRLKVISYEEIQKYFKRND